MFDYLINSGIAIEVKSGKEYKAHSALTKLVDSNLTRGIVLSNSNIIEEINNITYYPIYMVMFINNVFNNIEEINKLLFN